ncbi:MAG: hypothetical protein ACSLFL_05535 [Alphaproteobacteria bacterium]
MTILTTPQMHQTKTCWGRVLRSAGRQLISGLIWSYLAAAMLYGVLQA